MRLKAHLRDGAGAGSYKTAQRYFKGERVREEAVGEILAGKDRAAAKGAAPPHGLTLVAVAYGESLPRPGWVPETT